MEEDVIGVARVWHDGVCSTVMATRETLDQKILELGKFERFGIRVDWLQQWKIPDSASVEKSSCS